jgi:two-component system chemotaxis response regulator CheY
MPQTLLIVDDSATTRAMIKRIVTLCGIDPACVLQAADGKEALDVLDTHDVHLVLADLHMPVMGGLEMTRRILADPTLRHVPVVIVSADPNAARIDELKQQGVKGYLAKPFTPESFRDVIDQLLGARAHAA